MSNRIAGLDLIRAAAIVLVVLNHSVEVACGLHDVDVVNQMSTGAQWFAFINFTLGRLGVPLFFFLSGYLLLPRGFDQQSTERFYRRNVLTLLATWECWIIIYNAMTAALEGMQFDSTTAFMTQPHAFDPAELIRTMLFVESVDMMHVWYVGVILGIYLFLPWVARVLPSMSDKELLALTAIAFAYYFVLPTVQLFVGVKLQPWIDLSFSGGTYGLYVVMGYLLRRFEPMIERSIGKIFLTAATVGAILATAYTLIEFYRHGDKLLMWYDVCTLPIAASGLFIALKRLAIENRLTETLSRFSFGIYLLHAPILILMIKYDVWSTLGRSARTCCLLAAAVVLSTVIIKVCGLAPTVQRFLFRVK